MLGVDRAVQTTTKCNRHPSFLSHLSRDTGPTPACSSEPGSLGECIQLEGSQAVQKQREIQAVERRVNGVVIKH